MVTLNLKSSNKMAKLWCYSSGKTSLPKVLVALKSTSKGKFWSSSGMKFLDRFYEICIVVVTATILPLEYYPWVYN